MNHIGGRNHLVEFTMPFCKEHHDEFHVKLRQAGVNLTFTSNKVERTRRALQAIKIAEWMLLEQLKQGRGCEKN
jgi:hypothetical protein